MEIQELKSKWWYRLLKVTFIFAYIMAILWVFGAALSEVPYEKEIYTLNSLKMPSLNTGDYSGGTWTTITKGSWNAVIFIFFGGLIITLIIFEIIKGIFFYVATGKWVAFKYRKKQ